MTSPESPLTLTRSARLDAMFSRALRRWIDQQGWSDVTAGLYDGRRMTGAHRFRELSVRRVRVGADLPSVPTVRQAQYGLTEDDARQLREIFLSVMRDFVTQLRAEHASLTSMYATSDRKAADA